MVITPTLTCGSVTWTVSHEHEKLIRSTQCKMLRLMVQTQRKYKTKSKKEVRTKNCLLRHRLRLFKMVITPTLTYRSGTWTVSHEHEKLIRSQRKMLRLIVQTKRKYKTKSKMEVTTKNSRTMKEANKIPKTKLMRETARIQDVIKTATYLYRVTQMTTWTRLKSKRKN